MYFPEDLEMALLLKLSDNSVSYCQNDKIYNFLATLGAQNYDKGCHL